jgi:hypothetical protein
MRLELVWLNCLWLILPLLAWNGVLGPRITQDAITSDAHSPKWLLMSENILRVLVFALPMLMPLPGLVERQSGLHWAGLVIYILGTLAYFASWLPLLFAPTSGWGNSPAGLLAPRLTPYLSFLGIALLGGSWAFGIIAAGFILLHTLHGIQNLLAT